MNIFETIYTERLIIRKLEKMTLMFYLNIAPCLQYMNFSLSDPKAKKTSRISLICWQIRLMLMGPGFNWLYVSKTVV